MTKTICDLCRTEGQSTAFASNWFTLVACDRSRRSTEPADLNLDLCPTCFAQLQQFIQSYNFKEITPQALSFRHRVRAEKSELDGRRDKLTEFLKSDTFRQLTKVERDRLLLQKSLMHDYSEVLADRIAHFSTEPCPPPEH